MSTKHLVDTILARGQRGFKLPRPDAYVFEVNRARVLPEVLDVHFRNAALWASIGGASTGTNVRRRRLNPRDFLDLVLPLPSMARQRLLAKACEDVQAVKARQSESRAMLHALLPAILDRAFSGAL